MVSNTAPAVDAGPPRHPGEPGLGVDRRRPLASVHRIARLQPVARVEPPQPLSSSDVNVVGGRHIGGAGACLHSPVLVHLQSPVLAYVEHDGGRRADRVEYVELVGSRCSR
jgi:hypothetical protein